MAVEIEGVAPDAVPGFLAGLAQASETLAAIPARLEAARVHDAAFGKLIDAAKVRDAYHQRLPATEENITEARELIDHFLAQFGGAPLVVGAAPEAGAGNPRPQSSQSSQSLEPASSAPEGSESAETASAEVTAPEAEPVPAIAAQAEPVAGVSAPAEPEEPIEAAVPVAPVEPETADEPAGQAPAGQAPVERALSELIPGQGEPPAVESIPDEPLGFAVAAPTPVPAESALAEPAPAPEPKPRRARWWSRKRSKQTGRDGR